MIGGTVKNLGKTGSSKKFVGIFDGTFHKNIIEYLYKSIGYIRFSRPASTTNFPTLPSGPMRLHGCPPCRDSAARPSLDGRIAGEAVQKRQTGTADTARIGFVSTGRIRHRTRLLFVFMRYRPCKPFRH